MQIAKDDYGYTLVFTIQDANGNAYPLTDYTPVFKVWKSGSPGIMLEENCTSLLPAEGVCSYEIQQGDFTKLGTYLAEIELQKSRVVESTCSFSIEVVDSR
jgi:hypothetical protein